MNMKTKSKGKNKHQLTMHPIRSSLDWKIEFLREFAAFLELWENSKTPGLSPETFLALRHTCLSLADCAAYLLDRLGFSFVLLGQLQSDAIESRFGWLGQLSGANYYISMRQVLKSDRKIRVMSLVKYSNFSLSKIEDALQNETNATDSADGNIADDIAAALKNLKWPEANDANIICYISGMIGRSVFHYNRCDDCKEALLTSDLLGTVEIDDNLDYNASTFMDAVNRGGLSKPTEFTFMVAINCWQVFEMIRSSTSLKDKLLGASCQRSLFCKIMDRAIVDETYGPSLLVADNFCVKGHDLKSLLVKRFFNCVAKNLSKDLTHKVNVGKPSKQRKICKLQSQMGS